VETYQWNGKFLFGNKTAFQREGCTSGVSDRSLKIFCQMKTQNPLAPACIPLLQEQGMTCFGPVL